MGRINRLGRTASNVSAGFKAWAFCYRAGSASNASWAIEHSANGSSWTTAATSARLTAANWNEVSATIPTTARYARARVVDAGTGEYLNEIRLKKNDDSYVTPPDASVSVSAGISFYSGMTKANLVDTTVGTQTVTYAQSANATITVDLDGL